MSLQVVTFDGQPNGVAATTATSDDNGDPIQTWSKGTGGTGAYTTADASHGDACVQLQSTTASTATVLFDVDDAAASGSFSIAIDFKWTSYPTVTNDQMPIAIRSLSAAIGRLESSTTGQLRISMVNVSAYSTALALNTWYRLEWYGTGVGTAATNSTLDIYLLDNTGTPFSTVSHTASTTAVQAQRVRYGRAAAATLAAMTCRIDSIRQNIGSSTPMGPYLLGVAASDSATQSEGTSAVEQGRTANDTATMSETLTDVLITDTVIDDQTQTEGATLLAASSLATDAATETEGSTSIAAITTASDASTVAEGASSIVADGVASDSATQTELATVLVALFATSDSAIQSEGTTALLQAYTANDSATQNEDPTGLLQSYTANDSATQTEGTTVLLQSYAANDSATQTEGTTGLLQGLTASDTATQGESPTVIDAAIAANDAWTLTETSSLNAGNNLSASDSATQAESPSLLGAASATSDSATQTEGATVLVVSLLAQDSCVQSEAATSLLVSILANDTETLLDTSSITRFVDISASDLFVLSSELANVVELEAESTIYKLLYPNPQPTTRLLFPQDGPATDLTWSLE